jgi:molecular chaperone DnaJ
MSAKRDYYEVLGVTKDADARSIKTAYRKLAMKFHPDRNPGDNEAEERFKEAAEAYEVLSDDSKRAIYDRAGFDGLRSGGFAPGFSGDLGDIFSQFGDIFAEFFGGGAGGGRGARPSVGADIGQDLEITLEEVATGVSRRVDLRRHIACTPCSGTGAENGDLSVCAGCGGRGQVVQGRGGFMIATTCRACGGVGQTARAHCPSCGGRGQVQEDKTIEVKVPPGVDNGVRLRLQGEGDAGLNGGPRGDLYVFIHVKPHHLFLRRAEDLHCELSIDFPMACLGGEATITRLGSGEEVIRIPPASKPGDLIRLTGAGLARLNGRGTGDLLVHLTIHVPSKLTDEQSQVVKQLSERMPFEPSMLEETARQKESTARPRKKKSGFFERLRDAFEADG